MSSDKSVPPASLARQADEAALQQIDRRIRRWMVHHAAKKLARPTGCGFGIVPAGINLEEYVNIHYRELWPLVPEDLRREYQEVEARLAKPNEQEGGKGQTPPPTPDRPRKLLTGWREIADALEMKTSDKGKIKSLDDRYGGPIKNRGSGSQPLVYHDELLEWWNSLAALQQELANQREGQRLSAEAQHNYGRDGTAAPEVGGGVKRRRKDRKP